MLNDIRRVAKPGSAVFIISDFHDFSTRCAEPLTLLARHTTLNLFHIFDSLEQSLPLHRALSLSNGLTRLSLAGQSRKFSQAYQQSFEDQRLALRKCCQQSAITLASLPVSQSLDEHVPNLFHSSRKGGTYVR